jgi:hypothetical protein
MRVGFSSLMTERKEHERSKESRTERKKGPSLEDESSRHRRGVGNIFYFYMVPNPKSTFFPEPPLVPEIMYS